MRLQEKALKLDKIMRKLAEGNDPAQLENNQRWKELLALHRSLQNILPSELVNNSIV